MGLAVGELLGISNSFEFGEVLGADVAGGYDEGTEVVALPAFVDPDMPLIHE